MKKNIFVKSIVAIISVLTVLSIHSVPVYAKGLVGNFTTSKNGIPAWAIVIGIIVVIGNIIRITCKVKTGRDNYLDWVQQQTQQQTQQQMQRQLAQQEQDRYSQEEQRSFQDQQWQFQDQQWHDFNQFNNF